jgi:site-specific DNA-cytosine methylase
MSANLGESIRLGKRVCEEDSAVTLRASDGKMGDNQPVVAMSYDRYNQAGKEECCHTLGTCNSESPNNDKVVKVAIGFKAGQSKDGGLGDEREVSPTLSHNPSALEPTMAQMTMAQMKYIVRRLTPIECERLMGLPDGWTIPKNLEVTDALVEEFREKHDTFKRIMAEYDGSPMPKPTSAAQVRKWLDKITKADTCPDAPRYKACGNGWAANQPRWILTRLLTEEEVEW